LTEVVRVDLPDGVGALSLPIRCVGWY
jgi:hypothetical protein